MLTSELSLQQCPLGSTALWPTDGVRDPQLTNFDGRYPEMSGDDQEPLNNARNVKLRYLGMAGIVLPATCEL